MSKTVKDKLDELVDNYEKQVADHDENGYADIFKSCSEIFFKELEDSSDKIFPSFHAKDVKYLDGYFIFGFGTNSVVHFHIEECPGWLFGIWWDQPEKNTDNQQPEYVRGEFFAQYEDEIDKFKPSNSFNSSKFSVSLSHGTDLFSVQRLVNFINIDPELAFCRDYNYWDYNEEYHSREEAKEEFNNYKKWKQDKIEQTEILNNKVLDFIKANVMPLYKECELVDAGSSWSPRYSLVAPYEPNKNMVDDLPGYYDCVDDDDPIAINYKKLIDECKQVASSYEFFWCSPIHLCINLYAEDKTDA